MYMCYDMFDDNIYLFFVGIGINNAFLRLRIVLCIMFRNMRKLCNFLKISAEIVHVVFIFTQVLELVCSADVSFISHFDSPVLLKETHTIFT